MRISDWSSDVCSSVLEFDLLLADIVMPGADGIEVARRAGAGFPDLRIMLLTGFAALMVRAQGAGLGRARVLAKPMHLRDLVDRVEAGLARSGHFRTDRESA